MYFIDYQVFINFGKMKNFPYELDKSSRKFICPGCEKRRFVKYIDIETNQYLPERFGRCDREVNCGYFIDPYKEGYGKKKAGSNL